MYIRQASLDEINGTHRYGKFFLPFEELVRRIGEPHESNLDKSFYQWRFAIVNADLTTGAVFTIYDYKEEWPPNQHSQNVLWSIGSKDVNKDLFLPTIRGMISILGYNGR